MKTPPGDGGPSDKMEWLEAIRGLAALLVVVTHLVQAFWPALFFRSGTQGWEQFPAGVQMLARFPGKFLWNGHLIIPVFFVLSGFVLSLTFFRAGSAQTLGSAATRRYLRLMLPVAASVFFALILLQCGAICVQPAARLMNANSGQFHEWLAMYYTFSPDFLAALKEATWDAFTSISHYNLVLWTMPIELIGSFLVFGFLALFGGMRNRWLLYAILGGACLAGGHVYLMDFCVGMALCDLWAHNQKTWQKTLPLHFALGLIAVAVFLVPWGHLAAVLVVGGIAAAPSVQKLLAARALTFLGRVSFGLYLLHMPILCSLGCGLYLVLCGELGWQHSEGAAIAALATLIGSLLMGWIFYHAVDRPTLAVTRKLDIWLFRPRRDAGPNAHTSPPPMARAA